MNNLKIRNKIGEAIRRQRLLKNISRDKLGEKINLTGQQIAHYENAEHRISIEILYKIAEALETNFINFLPKKIYKEDEMACQCHSH